MICQYQIRDDSYLETCHKSSSSTLFQYESLPYKELTFAGEMLPDNKNNRCIKEKYI